MTLQSIIHDICPPVFLKLVRRLRSRPLEITFTGDYKSWDQAQRASTGYAAPEILARTRTALLKVKNGKAAFERDSVTFDTMQHEFPLLAGLLRAAASNNGRLGVLDFGGSLGSTYFQCREFLSIVKDLRWSVVDQLGHVACGQADFANEQLRFYRTIDDCLSVENPDVLLLSSVLQYLPRPYAVLDRVLQRRLGTVIVARTAFLAEEGDLLTVQHVPDWIYRASYPAWFLSEERFLTSFEKDYRLIASFTALDQIHPQGRKACCKGFIFSLKY